MQVQGSYIQYAEGYNKDGISVSDVDKAVEDLSQMDDEHGAFWVVVYGEDTDEMVLEIHKDFTLFGNFGKEDTFKVNLQSAEASIDYFNLLLKGNIEELKSKFKKMIE